MPYPLPTLNNILERLLKVQTFFIILRMKMQTFSYIQYPANSSFRKNKITVISYLNLMKTVTVISEIKEIPRDQVKTAKSR